MTFRSPVLRLALLTASTLLALSGCDCGRECTVPTDCPNPGQVCDQGVCKEGPDAGPSCNPSCPTNQFCDTTSLTCKNCDGTFPSGSGVNRGCTATTPICDTSANGGLGQCRSCAPTGTGGASDPGCGGQFPVCDPALNGGLGQCVTCTSRGGCGNGRVCDTSVSGGACKTCIPSTDGGVANGCTAAEPVCVVSGTTQSCKVCTATAGCTGGTLCDVTANTGKGQCDYCLPGGDGGVSRGCTAGAPVCDPARDAGYGACIVCNAGAGCGSPLICDVADNGGTGKCKYCYDGSGSTDPGCTSGAPVCNTAGDAGLGACVGCLSSGDCNTAPNFVCDTMVNRCKLCVLGPPQEGCNSGQTCDPLANGGQGACLGCTTDQNCQLPDGGGPTPHCVPTPPPGTCVECVTTPDCTDPTRPVCNGGNVCGCTGNPDCGSAAGKPICDTAANSGNGVCVVCTPTQGCSGDAPFCSNGTQCICRDNSDCPVGKACVGSPASCQPVDLSGAQTGILQFLDAGVGSVGTILIDGAYITYFKPAIGTTNSDPPGFFMQAQASGPGMYVAIDPVTIGADGGSLAVGDRVQLTVTSKYLIGSTTVPAANGIAGMSVLSANHPVRNLDTDTPAGLVVDVSNATDVVSNIPAYLSRVVRMDGFIDGGFVSSGTDHLQADFPTAGVPAVPVPRLRLPSNVLDALDIGQGCRVTLKVGPFWRFTATAQPTAYSPGDLQVISCSFAPSVLWAYALSDTSVEVTFDHNIDPASVDATDFTISGGLVVLTAISNGGKKVVLGTTPQSFANRYTVTASGITGVSGVPMSTTANHADFTGYGPPPSGLVINEIDYDNPGTDNFEYVELYNGSANPVDLGALDLVLVNGLDTSTIAHREYSRFHLIATVDDAGVPANLLPAGGYMVFGRGDGGTLNLLAPVPDSALRLSFPNQDTIQNGFADGVGILHYASGQLLDSVVYEPVATTEQTTFTVATGVGDRTYNFAEGNAPTTAADISNDAGALARQPNGVDTNNNNADFQFVIPYTPGSANP